MKPSGKSSAEYELWLCAKAQPDTPKIQKCTKEKSLVHGIKNISIFQQKNPKLAKKKQAGNRFP